MNDLDCLRLFCEHLISKYGNPSKIPEDLKAEEFREFFLRDLPVNVRSLRNMACACGFHTEALESDKIPAKLRGYHEMINGKKSVYFREEDSQSGIQNTILHETREIMESYLAQACPTYRPLRTSALHMAANHFAAAFLLPEKRFVQDIYNTGFDVIALSQNYSKSCAQILLRMGEVLRGKAFFYGALYSPESDNSEKWTVSYCTQSTAASTSLSYWYRMNGYLPRKGRAVKSGSFVEQTIITGKPHWIEYQIQEYKNNGSLIILSQPQIINKTVNKVAVVIIPKENQDLLAFQIERLKPVKLDPILQNK